MDNLSFPGLVGAVSQPHLPEFVSSNLGYVIYLYIQGIGKGIKDARLGHKAHLPLVGTPQRLNRTYVRLRTTQ